MGFQGMRYALDLAQPTLHAGKRIVLNRCYVKTSWNYTWHQLLPLHLAPSFKWCGVILVTFFEGVRKEYWEHQQQCCQEQVRGIATLVHQELVWATSLLSAFSNALLELQDAA
eukprot:1404193-Amphidinium_carterae.1